jgi:F-type H+-transporting ATPase subunit b
MNFATFEEQVVWLFLSFIALFLIVSRLVLPRVTKVLEEREERIATDLDTAERLKKEAEDVKNAYEEAVALARKNAQDTILGAKEQIQADIAKAQAELDASLAAKAAEAEASIAKAREDALASVGDVAREVAGELVAKLGGLDGSDASVAKAVDAALSDVKGA